jgi:CubicO group peptidase (beta-lactamase class C family)
MNSRILISKPEMVFEHEYFTRMNFSPIFCKLLFNVQLLFVSLLFFTSCNKENDPEPGPYFPPIGSSWEKVTPASLGWDESKIPELKAFLVASNSRAFIVLKDGKIVIEEYMGNRLWDNPPVAFDVNSVWYWASAGKTLTAVLVGKAESQGKINLDARTADYIGQGWTSLPLIQENKVTVRHQLTMTTGLDDNLTNNPCTEPACLAYLADPGSRWGYHNRAYSLLDDVISNATGQTLNIYLDKEIKSKTGMDGQLEKQGYNNVYYSTARSMARFGLLLLNKGKWKQDQIIPEDFYNLMISSSQNLNLSYGYLTWLNGKSSFMAPESQAVIPGSITPNAPADMFAAMGKSFQIVNIVPSKNIVVIRMGDDPDSSPVPFQYQDELWKMLNEIIKKDE